MCIFLSVNVVLMSLTLPLQRFGTLTQAFLTLANQTSAYVRAVWSVSELSESHEPNTRVTVCTTLKESDKKQLEARTLVVFGLQAKWCSCQAHGQLSHNSSQGFSLLLLSLFTFPSTQVIFACDFCTGEDTVSGGYLFGGQHCQDVSIDVKIISK